MKTLTLLAMLVTATMLLGCSSDPCGCCGEFEANCCGWEFYKPCDLIEGKRACCDIDPCAQPVVVRAAPQPAPAPAAAPEAPAPDASAEAPAGDGGPMADFAWPPAGR